MKKTNVFELISCMAALIRSEERKRCSELKLQLTHLQVLEYISLCNKYSDTPAALANYLGMTRGTVSQTLIVLEKKGLLTKIQDTADKRVYHLQLTVAGVDILQQAKPTNLFEQANDLLGDDFSSLEGDALFVAALTALQKANHSQSFGVCKTCKNFTQRETGFFCELTKEVLSEIDADKICQEHVAH